jgi:hypothetical protein
MIIRKNTIYIIIFISYIISIAIIINNKSYHSLMPFTFTAIGLSIAISNMREDIQRKNKVLAIVDD